ncbi:aldehyde dehydrogenase family protein, partial [Pseudactinotalea sp. Z1748]|uniref:aldehyde dehydrogenase family protein n=1 Tax=Pseudactinotalea sp. Z1748 TaxID=3413027 RepID=UPI003C7E7067
MQGQDGPEGQVPTLLRTTADAMLADPDALQAECFGPTALVVEYENLDQAVQVARTYGGQLTAGVFGQDDCPVQPLLAVLTEIAGRVIWNQWPTGVSVTYAQQHGGPYPATTAV